VRLVIFVGDMNWCALATSSLPECVRPRCVGERAGLVRPGRSDRRGFVYGRYCEIDLTCEMQSGKSNLNAHRPNLG